MHKLPVPLGTHFISTSSSISERTAQIPGAVLGMGEREAVQSNLRQPGLICQAPSLVAILQLSDASRASGTTTAAVRSAQCPAALL